MDRASSKNQQHGILAGMERLVTASESLTDLERKELAAWEQKYVTGDGKFVTSDWPGWISVYKRIEH